MTVLLNITTVPQDFAAGTYNTAAIAINSGKWRITVTPTSASSTYTGGNFHAIFGQDHGGLWFNDKNLELYTTPGDNLAFSVPLTWSAGQAITVSVDARAGHLTATISGATTGNGTISLSFAGPYVDGSLLLECGHQSGGTNFQFVGGISPIDDGISSDAIVAAAIAITGGTVNDRVGFKDGVTSATIAIAARNVSEGRGANSEGVTPATIAVIGGSVNAKRAYADFVSSAQVAIVGSSIPEGQGGQVSLGPTTMDFQRFGFANRPSSVSMNTPSMGAVVLLCAGGRSSDITVAWTDSKNTAAPVLIGALVEYADFAGYGTVVALTPAPMTGGTGHTFTQPVTTNDENTTFALTASVVGGHPRVTEVHNNVANAGATTTQTSPSITIDGEALLVAFWWGASPVVPPFSSPSPGVGTPYTAVPNNGFIVAQSYLVNNEFGEVQGAMAYLYVPASTGPSTQNVTWTHSPAQGAQLRLVAIQPALSDGLTPAVITLTGQPVGERVAYRAVVLPAALSVVGGTITEGLRRSDIVSPATVAVVGGSVADQRTTVESVTPALLAIVGGSVSDRHASVETVASATIIVNGGSVQDRRSTAASVTPSAVLLVGGSIQDHRTTIESVTSAALTVQGGTVTDQIARNQQDSVQSATVSLLGGSVFGVVGAVDRVTTAALSLIGGSIATRQTFADAVTAATIALVGKNVQDAVSSNAQDSVSPATIAVVSSQIGDRIGRVAAVQPAALTLTGSAVMAGVSRRASVQPASVTVQGGLLQDRNARQDAVLPAFVSVVGGAVQDQVATGIRDAVTPALVFIVGNLVQTRVIRAVRVSTATLLIHGSDIRVQITGGSVSPPPPIPPGRASGTLVGRVVVPSIESREAEDGHLFGVVRSNNNV